MSARLGRTTARAADRSAPGARTGARSHRRVAPVAVRGVWGSDRVDIPRRMTRLRGLGDVPRYLDGIGELDPGHGSLIRAALHDIARTYGVTRLAREPSPSRVGSYKALAASRNPSFSTRMRIARIGTEADNHHMAPFHTIGRPRVVGGVKPRINGEQHAPGTTRYSAGRQGVTSRQAATRLLRCAPALQVTRRNPLTRLVFMAGSELPAIAGPIPRSRRSRCQPLHLVFAIYRRFFAAVNTTLWCTASPARFVAGPARDGPHLRRMLDKTARIVEHRRPNAQHRREAVNRTELCARIAARSSLSRADAATAVDAVVSAIADALQRGETVNITDFGKFTTRHRAARQGRNPRTGEAVSIPARTVPAFKAGKALRDRFDG